MGRPVNNPFCPLVKRRQVGGYYAEKGLCKEGQKKGRVCYSTVKSKIQVIKL